MKEKRDVLNSLMEEITGLKIMKPEKVRAKRRLYIAIGLITSAASVLLFLLYFAFGFETYRGIQEADNVFYLPDETRVVLAPGSQISFSKYFFKRNVRSKGDAFFEVTHGNDFSVKSPNGEVKVLGTTFCVSEKDDGFLVTCFEGNVEVKFKEEERQLFKGDQYVREHNFIQVVEVPQMKFPEYVSFNYSFQNKNINEIWPIIENYFGVKIYTDIPVEKRFTGSFKTAELNDVIEIICISLDLTCQKVGEKEIFVEVNDQNS
ncbi:MAG: FecR family protein [Prolixibacteraceae bacterium]|nr:FecR family protein [Prolixibacteraceae bacterium]